MVKEGYWEYTERTNATGAVIIVAITDEQRILLVEQHRVPIHAQTIEFPAGIIGDEPGGDDEAQVEAALRELVEETGYEAQEIVPLMHGPSCSGLTSERVTLFLARRLRRVGTGGGVGHEDIKVHEVPLAEVHDWLEAMGRTGVLVDPKVYAGLYFVTRNGDGPPVSPRAKAP